MAHRGYTDDGTVFIGFYASPQLKRELVDEATKRGHSLSAFLRDVTERSVQNDEQKLAAA